jgi:excisionase family DNA binding protein
METINFIQTTPTELANLIAQAVRQELKMLNRQVEKPSEPTKDLMTRKEVAKLFDISLVTIHDWCNSGILKPYKVGNRTYFKRVEVMEALSNPNQIIL